MEVSGETRKRHAIYNGAPQILINENGISFGQRFYLPGNNDAGKLQGADNFSYSFGRHDMKFGGDVDSFTDRKDIFAGWSTGEYEFNTLCDFDPAPPLRGAHRLIRITPGLLPPPPIHLFTFKESV